MKYEVKDLNAPSRWNMRIWDDDNGEWLCQSDKNALTYYGFDITGGEITEFQGLPKWHKGRHLIWEQSTGLKDKNGKEIYEGDIVEYSWDFCGEKRKNRYVVEWLSGNVEHYPYSVDSGFTLPDSVDGYMVVGNIHENQELIGKDEAK